MLCFFKNKYIFLIGKFKIYDIIIQSLLIGGSYGKDSVVVAVSEGVKTKDGKICV